MAIGTAATPGGAPAMDDDAIANAFAALDSVTEDEAGTPLLAEDEEADSPQDGDAEEAPEQGDDADTAEDAEEAEKAAETPALDMTAPVKVKVNGEEIEVPLEEALKGYSRLEDYKAKTAELAQERRAVVGEYAERLQTALDTFIQADPVLAAVANVDWTQLAKDDPAAFVQLRAETEQRQAIIADAQRQIAEARAQEAQATAQREYELLVKADPSLADADTYNRRIGELTDYLTRNHGFSEAELNGINNHKYVLIAEKAAAYDKLMAAKKELPAKVAPPPKPQAKPLKSSGSAAQAPRTSRPPPPNAPDRVLRAWFEKNL